MLKKLSLAKKLIVSNLLYGLPVLVLMNLMIASKTEQIEFAEQERFGNEYQAPIEALMEGVSRHRLAAKRALMGDSEGRATLSVQADRIDRDFQVLRGVDARLGKALQFTDEGLKQRKREHLRLAVVQEKWKQVQERVKSGITSPEIDQLHASLIGDLRGMITHLGDTSNLILDPDLDSYYLMDLSLMALPQLQDRIQEVTSYVEGVLFRGRITAEERVQLGIYAALLQSSDLDRLIASSQTAINEDQRYYGISASLQERLPKELAVTRASVERFVAFLREIAKSETMPVSAKAFRAGADEALAASYGFWALSSHELGRLLEARIESIRSDRLRDVIMGLLALAFAVAVSWRIVATLRHSLTGAVARLTQSAQNTNVASDELVRTSQSLSSASNEQAAAIQETTATLDEINAMLRKSLENANGSARVAESSQKTAVSGKMCVEDMIRAIGEISDSNDDIVRQINESNEQISEIVKIINEIGLKTKVINDIVFQTKLLSFNASVEAARAGEHGKGFAVVAEEVGNLAQMSGNAAKEITNMLESSVHQVTSIVDETKSKVERLVSLGRAKVDAGTQVAHRCGAALEEIVQTVSQVTQMVAEISSAAEEQAKGVNEITKAMQQLDQTTQQNTQLSNETASHSGELSSQAEELRQIVSSIQADVFGQQTGSVAGQSAGSRTGRRTVAQAGSFEDEQQLAA